MKRILMIMATIVLVFAFTACSVSADTEEAATSDIEQVDEATETPLPEPTEEPTLEPTEEPTPESQLIQNSIEIINSMLVNPRELWSEGSGGFSENNGGEFGGGVKMGYNPDMQRLEIFGEENGACAKFNTSLMTCMTDVGMEPVPQQSVLVKFSASDIAKARISFDALDEIDFSFRDDGIYFVDVANFLEMPISDFAPNSLELKNDTIYNFFFAFDAEGNIRMFVWEDGFVENHAYFEYDLYQDASKINNCDLIMHLAIGENEQINIYEYWIYTFENFADASPFLSAIGN